VNEVFAHSGAFAKKKLKGKFNYLHFNSTINKAVSCVNMILASEVQAVISANKAHVLQITKLSFWVRVTHDSDWWKRFELSCRFSGNNK